MKRKCAVIAEYRSKIYEDNVMVIHVGSNDDFMKDVVVNVKLDGKDVPFTMEKNNTVRSRNCYKAISMFFSCEYQYVIPVTDTFKKVVFELKFRDELEAEPQKLVVSGKAFRETGKTVFEYVDEVKKENNGIVIKGWTTGKEETDIAILYRGKPIEFELNKHIRRDVNERFLEGECKHPMGFEITIKDIGYRKITMILTNGDRRTVKNIYTDKTNNTNHYFYKTKMYFKRYGFARTVKKIREKLFDGRKMDYAQWIHRQENIKDELKIQRNTTFENNPKFSIVVPVYNPPKVYFEEMLKSILEQSYSNWELCIADGGESVLSIVQDVMGDDPRVKYTALSENLGISENTNKALEMSTGDFIVLGDHDDIIRPNALYECANVINENSECDVIYSDEDKVEGRIRKYPNFKPDFSPDYLRSNNYICHLFVFSRRLYELVGGFNGEYDGAQDHDLIFRCCENARQIVHIPKVLYSWRMHKNSTAMNFASKMYAYENGKKAVKAHLDRIGLKGEVEIDTKHPGVYRVIYELTNKPMVSILIPNKDHTVDLDKCIRSIVKQNYTNYEIIIIENNSVNQTTFDYYEKIQKEFDCVRVIYWEDEFNYSAINNFGAKEARGEYFLLLNNDTEMVDEDCLRELVSYGIRPEVGIVGAKLLYGDETIQHAGVIIGLGGLAGHAFVGMEGDEPGYQIRAAMAINLSAVTAACLLVRRSVYEQVGGLDEILKVAFNDVDFCLKVREAGYLVVYNPYAVLYHYESKSRGAEDTAEKIQRFQSEITYTSNKWQDILAKGDPYYNINLSLKRHDFSLRE